ncbi:MAG: hypothetical protein WC479_09960 [Candidatus Izemoplasmatales bacterium]
MVEEKTEVQEPNSMLERAEAAAKAMKEQNDRAEEIAKRNEKVATILQLGGGTNAGQTPVPPKVETPKEYADRVLKGEIKPI